MLYVTSRHPWWKCRHLCGQRRIYCLGTPEENPFKTNCREGLSCSPIQLFSTPHLIREHGRWWCCESHLKTKNKTNYPSPPKFLDNPDIPFRPSGPSPAGGKEKVVPRKNSRERLPLRPSPPEPQLIPISYE